MTLLFQPCTPDAAEKWLWSVIEAIEETVVAIEIEDQRRASRRLLASFSPSTPPRDQDPIDFLFYLVTKSRGARREALRLALPGLVREAASSQRYIPLELAVEASRRLGISAVDAGTSRHALLEMLKVEEIAHREGSAMRALVRWFVETLDTSTLDTSFEDWLDQPYWDSSFSWAALEASARASQEVLTLVLRQHHKQLAIYLMRLSDRQRASALEGVIRRLGLSRFCAELTKLDPSIAPDLFVALFIFGGFRLDATHGEKGTVQHEEPELSSIWFGSRQVPLRRTHRHGQASTLDWRITLGNVIALWRSAKADVSSRILMIDTEIDLMLTNQPADSFP